MPDETPEKKLHLDDALDHYVAAVSELAALRARTVNAIMPRNDAIRNAEAVLASEQNVKHFLKKALDLHYDHREREAVAGMHKRLEEAIKHDLLHPPFMLCPIASEVSPGPDKPFTQEDLQRGLLREPAFTPMFADSFSAQLSRPDTVTVLRALAAKASHAKHPLTGVFTNEQIQVALGEAIDALKPRDASTPITAHEKAAKAAGWKQSDTGYWSHSDFASTPDRTYRRAEDLCRYEQIDVESSTPIASEIEDVTPRYATPDHFFIVKHTKPIVDSKSVCVWYEGQYSSYDEAMGDCDMVNYPNQYEVIRVDT